MQETEFRPIIFGEVLFDCFPDGRKVLGGAPFNIAWHLQGFGLAPQFVSRIGNDSEGETIRAAMQDWGMDTSALHIDAEHPTGQVSIELAEGQPTFSILPEQAYDYIQTDALENLDTDNAGLLYHGSLIMRSAVSRQTLHLLKQGELPVFVDINLRAPWWDGETVREALQGTRWLKLNHDELAELQDALGYAGDFPGQQAQELQAVHALDKLIVTCGGEGAFLLSAADRQSLGVTPQKALNIVDTVGAGDAFSAVILYGLLHDWPDQLTLRRAQTFAEAICQQRGATCPERDFYQRHLRQWQADVG